MRCGGGRGRGGMSECEGMGWEGGKGGCDVMLQK